MAPPVAHWSEFSEVLKGHFLKNECKIGIKEILKDCQSAIEEYLTKGKKYKVNLKIKR